MRLIDAEELKLVITYNQKYVNPKLDITDVMELIDNAPTVSAKVVLDRKTYQHNYYERVTKAKRKAKREGGTK